MLISVIHRISDPDKFFQMASESTQELPPHLRVLQMFSNEGRQTAVCLWEAPAVRSVEEFLEPLTQGVSKNEYAVVDVARSMGLPAITPA